MPSLQRIARLLPSCMIATLILPAALVTSTATAVEPDLDLEIIDVVLDKSTWSRGDHVGGDLRLQTGCQAVVSFEDATPPEPGTDGYYELRVDGYEWPIGTAYTFQDELPTSLTTYGCYALSTDEPSRLTLEYHQFDRSAGQYGEYVESARSQVYSYQHEVVGQPTAATVSGPEGGVGDDYDYIVLETGEEATISFTGSWDEDVDVIARVTATHGWKPMAKQVKGQVEIPTTYDEATQTFSFVPEERLSGRTVYVTVQGKDASPGGARADALWTWAPGLLVDPGAKPTRRSWVKTFGSVDKKKSSMWLHTTKASATKKGKKAGLKFLYQGWLGDGVSYSWHSNVRTIGLGEVGGCPAVDEFVRVTALVPGSLPRVKTFTMPAPSCRSSAGEPAAHGEAVGTGSVGSTD
ncbi:hypothetical protein [Nocardioides sp. REDSEA-S30_B4]|jgi:hypothetical protein|uniref:hypothetical protein n=1 Tax=Nocardioides sp. REDSEA-S30_B4 TaxID=1811552 RepID=UPI000A608E35|nr:hypothetical protein [Nocardioides sp. REDSEA-S30_B4]